MRNYFIDRAPRGLGKLERTPQGGYIVPATLARSGVMGYSADELRRQGLAVPLDQFPKGSTVRIYTPPEVLQKAMDTLKLGPCPVTNQHPPKMVDTETYRSVNCGSVIDSTLAFDGEYLSAHLAIQDARLLADIENRSKREVSMGYWADTVMEGGVTPEGETYDALRRELFYNHAAVVPEGRAGEKVCLALDSQEIPTEDEKENPVKLKIKGVETDVTQATIDALEGEISALTSKVATLDGALVKAQDELKEAASEETFSKRVAAKDAADKQAKEAAEKLEAVKKGFPDVVFDAKSPEFIEAHFNLLARDQKEDPDGIERLSGIRKTVVKDAQAPAEKPLTGRAKMLANKAKQSG